MRQLTLTLNAGGKITLATLRGTATLVAIKKSVTGKYPADGAMIHLDCEHTHKLSQALKSVTKEAGGKKAPLSYRVVTQTWGEHIWGIGPTQNDGKIFLTASIFTPGKNSSTTTVELTPNECNQLQQFLATACKDLGTK